MFNFLQFHPGCSASSVFLYHLCFCIHHFLLIPPPIGFAALLIPAVFTMSKEVHFCSGVLSLGPGRVSLVVLGALAGEFWAPSCSISFDAQEDTKGLRYGSLMIMTDQDPELLAWLCASNSAACFMVPGFRWFAYQRLGHQFHPAARANSSVHGS